MGKEERKQRGSVEEIYYNNAEHWKHLKTHIHVSRDMWQRTWWCGELPSHGGNDYTDCNQEHNTWQWVDGGKKKKKEREGMNMILKHI